MAVTNFIQTVWSKKIQDDLELKCKLVDNCLRQYEGDCKYARTVKILGVGEPTISAYSGATGVEYEQMSDRSQDLVIDQQYSFAFLVDDINQAQSVPGLKEEYQRKAVHGLAIKRDSYIASLIKGVTGNVTTATALTAEAVKTAIDAAIVALRERNFDELRFATIIMTFSHFVKQKIQAAAFSAAAFVFSAYGRTCSRCTGPGWG